MSLNWYALAVPPLAELRAEAGLQRRGYEVFCPHEWMWRRVSRHAKRRVVQKRALMRRYVFIRFDGQPPWHKIGDIEGVRGIARLVTFDGVTAGRIPDADIEHMKGLCRDAAPDDPSQMPRFRIGDTARVMAGPLQGVTIRIDKLDAKKAQTLFEMLGSKRTIEISLANLVAA